MFRSKGGMFQEFLQWEIVDVANETCEDSEVFNPFKVNVSSTNFIYFKKFLKKDKINI